VSLNRKLLIELLEDRTVPTSVTVLASNLHTAGGLPEYVRVAEAGTAAKGNDFTFDAAPGVYHLIDGDGGGTYGSFTLATDGTISGTTGALVASSSTIDFDLTKLAPVTIFGTDLKTAAGLQQSVGVPFVDVLISPGPGTDTVYLPAGTYRLAEAAGDYGGITVSVNGSGTLAVSATSGAAVATGNTIHFDLTQLAAVTVFGTDLKTAGGLQQALGVDFVVGLTSGGSSTDTVYLPAGTYRLWDPNFGAYGSFIVSANSSGALAVSAASGAAVATGNTIHFDLTQLAAVTIFGTDLKTAAGSQQIVRVPDIVPNVPGGAITDTVYCPARTFQVVDFVGHVYGTFTVAANASGALVVTGATGAAIATGNTIHFDACSLNRVQITPNSGSWYLEGQVSSAVADIVAIPDGSYTLFGPGNIISAPFSVSMSSGLSATQLPQDGSLATLQLVPCMEPPSLVVTTTADVVDPHDFKTSLREAINYANTNPGLDTITFAIPTTDPGYQSSTGAFIIKPTSALPTLTDAVVIDGYSQPGSSPNTLAIGDNAVLKIALDGSLAGEADGLVIGGGNSTVRGLVVDNFGSGTGIYITSGGNNLVVGNFIGTDATGVAPGANNNGLLIYSSGNTVGGTSPGDRNLISGNNSGLPDSADGGSQPGDRGIYIGNGNLLQGNYIGTDRSGTSALGNGLGIESGSNSTIGGLTATPGTGAGNLISGNTIFGIDRAGNQNLIAGNLIGTTATGLAALGNGAGVDLWGNNNTIGGTTAGARNIISGNTGPGGAGVINAGIDIENVTGGDLAGGSYNLVEGNYIGTDITGNTSLGRQGYGIISGGGSYNTIGGTTAASRNIISGNNGGIGIQTGYSGSFGNVIQGNYIGTDASGTQTVPNPFGGIILYKATHDNIIGGTLPGEGNLISGNSVGVWLNGNETGSPTNNRIQGNLIGTDKTGTVALGNGDGIAVQYGSNNTIGGTDAGDANTIAFNRSYGVLVESVGGSSTGNSILTNSIHDNGDLGIFLYNANNNQASPVLTSAGSSSSGTTISGTLQSVANTTFRIEFFANQQPNPSSYGEGQTFLGSTTVTTDGSGNASFTASLSNPVPLGERYLSATATVANSDSTFGDTSQFAKDLFLPFNFTGFLPPVNQNMAFALNRTIPIKFQLTDVDGSSITSLSAVTSLQIAPVNPDNSLGTPFNPTPTPGTSLRNDGSQYIFNWQTKGLAAGTYEILLSLSDGTLHTKVIQLSKNGSTAGLTTVAAGGSGSAPGGLLGGDITLYVDNTNGDLTADELARIQDAVTDADGVTEPYGVAVQEVSDLTLADVTLNMDTTSAVGGSADGVLGCTTDAGQITIINGWNFYAGSDATQIGSGQYDFETVVTHELGHALGLGHSTDSTSVMYATLNAGAINRSLTTADLNVPDTGTTGACGLHAAVVDVGRISNPSYADSGRIGNPSHEGEGRDMVFAMLAVDRSRNASMGPPLLAARDIVFTNGLANGPAVQAGVLAANFASRDSSPIFAAQLPRGEEESWLEAPLFPDRRQDGVDDADKSDGSSAHQAEQGIDFLAADPNLLDY
jgi:CSLREA domain-containing protein